MGFTLKMGFYTGHIFKYYEIHMKKPKIFTRTGPGD